MKEEIEELLRIIEERKVIEEKLREMIYRQSREMERMEQLYNDFYLTK